MKRKIRLCHKISINTQVCVGNIKFDSGKTFNLPKWVFKKKLYFKNLFYIISPKTKIF